MSESNVMEQPQGTAAMLAECDAALLMLATLVDTNGNTKSNALRRKQKMLRALIRQLRKSPEFVAMLPEADVELIVRASPLQDIGRSGIPDRILLKPGKLDEEEFDLMRTHPAIGFEALKEAEKRLGRSSLFLRYAQEIACCHQEKWDGSGYPKKLVGEAIPLSARLTAIIDVYNAITSRRVYKAALPHEKAIEIIRECRARDFDPKITDAFLAISQEIRDIARELADKYDEQEEIRRLESAAAEAITL